MEEKLGNIAGGYPREESSTVRIPHVDKQAVWQRDIEDRLARVEGRLGNIESRHPSESSTLRVICFDKGTTDSINDIYGILQTLVQKLDDQKGDHKQDGGATEKKMDGEKASVDLKGKGLVATVSGVPVVGVVIGLWVTIAVSVLYTREWLARRERRWRLRDEWREIQKVKGDWKGEDGNIGCVLM